MGKTFLCTFEGCDLAFSRAFQLKKHKATHEDPDSLHYCQNCDFYTLDPRNLEVHIAIHTGEKNYACPDTIKVSGPSGSQAEEPCQYRTNDRSLLTKHRTRLHGYVPRRRSSPRPSTTFTFVPYPVPSPTRTGNASPRAARSKRVQKRTATTTRSKSSRMRVVGEVKDSTGNAEHATFDGSLPSALQESADECEQQKLHVASPATIGSSSLGSNSAASPVPNEHAVDVHGQQAFVGSLDATSILSAGSSDATSFIPNEGIFLDTHASGQSANAESSSYAADFSSTTPVAPNQDVSTEPFLNPATDDDWSRYCAEGFTASSASNLQMDTFFTTGSFQMRTCYDDMVGWDPPAWDNFWVQHNSHFHI